MRLKLLFFLLIFLTGVVNLAAQNRTVSGTVTDNEGSPLIGVTVMVVGTFDGGSTDIDGKYTITDVPAGSTFRFTYLGFLPQEVKVTGATLNVKLSTDEKLLDEVIVVAYGTASKAGYTGSASTVNKDKIAQSQVSNVSRLLEGAAAGVQSIASSGQPGSEAEIYIRGVGSINASSRPL